MPPSLPFPRVVVGPPSDSPTPVVPTHGGGLDPAGGHGVFPPSYPRGATSSPKSTRCVASLVGGSWVPPTAVLQKNGPPEFVSSGGAGRTYRIDQITGIVLLLIGTTDSPQDHTLVGVVPEFLYECIVEQPAVCPNNIVRLGLHLFSLTAHAPRHITICP